MFCQNEIILRPTFIYVIRKLNLRNVDQTEKNSKIKKKTGNIKHNNDKR